MKNDYCGSIDDPIYMHDNQSIICKSEALTPMLILDEKGVIFACNTAAVALLECSPWEIAGQHVSTIVPQFAESVLLQDGMINPNLRFLFHIGFPFEIVNFSEKHIDCNLFFNEIKDFGKDCFRMIVRPVSKENTLN